MTISDDCAPATSSAQTGFLPHIIQSSGTRAGDRFVEFFSAELRNPHTRQSYSHAIAVFFDWVGRRGVNDIRSITPVMVAAHIEQLRTGLASPTVKQHLAAIRSLFDWMTTGGHLAHNPAASVRGPKHVVSKGTTPDLTAEETRQLLDSIPRTGIGLRDRALISLMVFTFARVSAAVGMKVHHYHQQGRRWWVRLHEKNGLVHHVPVHSRLEDAMEQYLAWLGDVAAVPNSSLFRACSLQGAPSSHGMSRYDAIRMIKRRARHAGLADTVCCHSFRATGITTYLRNGGTLETAQAIAGHRSSRTTSLYDRRQDEISLGEIERIII